VKNSGVNTTPNLLTCRKVSDNSTTSKQLQQGPPLDKAKPESKKYVSVFDSLDTPSNLDVDLATQLNHEVTTADTASHKPQPVNSVLVKEIAALFKARFLAADERRCETAARRAVAYLMKPPGTPGLPRTLRVTQAMKLLEGGVPWEKIPWRVIRNFGKVSVLEQRAERNKLYHAIYAHDPSLFKMSKKKPEVKECPPPIPDASSQS
jgi:hypothetical protein